MSSWREVNDLDDDSWQDMPVILPEDNELDQDDRKRLKWSAKATTWQLRSNEAEEDAVATSPTFGTAGGAGGMGNATGRLLDIDAVGQEWREKEELDEMDYTRLELDDDPEEDEISMRTQFLFNEDKGMTPLSQMQATKTLLTEGQRIAYVGLCRLVAREMIQTLAIAAKGAKELEPARESAENWASKIMGRLYRHMDVDAAEQRMIEQLAEHGVTAEDLVPALATTHTMDNPEYDPDFAPIPEEEYVQDDADGLPAYGRPSEEVDLEKDLKGLGLAGDDTTTAEQEEQRRARQAAEEEEELGRVAREVAKIERRHRTVDPFSGEEDDASYQSSPRPSRSPPVSPPRKAMPAFQQFDFDDGADIGGALDGGSSSSSLSKPVSLPVTTSSDSAPLPTASGDQSLSSSTSRPNLSSPRITIEGDKADLDSEIEVPTPRPGQTTPLSPPPASPSHHHSDNFLSPMPSELPGVSKTLTAADKTVTLDIRWTILCDLFLSLIADSVYDARSRVLLGNIADRLGLAWMDVVRFERRLTEALEIQENVKEKEHTEVLESQRMKGKRQRYMMMGLATLGGGLVIGLSAGLLAPVIGAGLGAALTTVGVTGTTSFLAGAGGAAIISSGATLTGSVIGGKAMAKRTRHVKTFEFQPLHNNKRVNYFITVPGFMNGPLDDVRLPFSTIDPVMGDVFSVLWEPDMMGDTGNALKILTSEVLTQAGQQVLALTVMTALLSALQWPLMLTKLSYLIDNPWSNALDRARQAGAVLADILLNRRLGVRPVSLVGFSLGARVIFFALIELAKQNAFGVVQEVYLFGATLTASKKVWRQVRGIVAGRFVNAFAMNDWVLGYLFRATSGGLQTVAGLRPIEHVPDLENVDITQLLTGHMSYRTLMPTLLAYVGFKTTADHFDEPDEMEMEADREVLTQEEEERRREKKERRGLAGFLKSKRKRANGDTASAPMSRNPSHEYDMPARLSTSSSTSLPAEGRTNGVPSRSSLSVEVEDERGSSSLESKRDEDDEEDEERVEIKRDAQVEAVAPASSLISPQTPDPQPEPVPELDAEPPKVASIPVGFNFDKIRQEVATAAKVKSHKPSQGFGASTTSLPPADLSNLDVTLDPHEVLRRKWSREELAPKPSAPFEGVDDWAPPRPGLEPSLSFTFGGEDGGWSTPKPASNGTSSAPTFEWGKENESTASLRPQNPW